MVCGEEERSCSAQEEIRTTEGVEDRGERRAPRAVGVLIYFTCTFREQFLANLKIEFLLLCEVYANEIILSLIFSGHEYAHFRKLWPEFCHRFPEKFAAIGKLSLN